MRPEVTIEARNHDEVNCLVRALSKDGYALRVLDRFRVEVGNGNLAEAVVDDATDTFAYATSGRYEGERSLVTRVLADDELLQFAREHRTLLPGRVRTWFELASDF